MPWPFAGSPLWFHAYRFSHESETKRPKGLPTKPHPRSHATHMFVKKKYPPGHIFLHEDGFELKHLAAAVVSPSVSLRIWNIRKSLQTLQCRRSSLLDGSAGPGAGGSPLRGLSGLGGVLPGCLRREAVGVDLRHLVALRSSAAGTGARLREAWKNPASCPAARSFD